MYFWKSLPRTETHKRSQIHTDCLYLWCVRVRACVRACTFDQRGHGHQSVLLNASGAGGALKHPEQRRHDHVGDLQGVLVLHFTEDVLQQHTGNCLHNTVTIRASTQHQQESV